MLGALLLVLGNVHLEGLAEGAERPLDVVDQGLGKNWSMRWIAKVYACGPSEVGPVPEEKNSVIFVLLSKDFCNRESAPCLSADTANFFG